MKLTPLAVGVGMPEATNYRGFPDPSSLGLQSPGWHPARRLSSAQWHPRQGQLRVLCACSAEADSTGGGICLSTAFLAKGLGSVCPRDSQVQPVYDDQVQIASLLRSGFKEVEVPPFA